jgi:hypothetical protein
MKTTAGWVSVVMMGLLGGACEAQEPSEQGEDSPKAEAQEAPGTAVGVKLERALRAIDRGEEIAAAAESLEAILADPTASEDQRDEARLGLSRTLELSGDDDGAAEMVEAVFTAHGDDDEFPARDAAEKRLRTLLTGRAQSEELRLPLAEALPPQAYALANLFEPDAEGRVLVDMAIFGGPGRGRSRLFDAAEAKRERLYTSVGATGWIGQSITQTEWTSLPKMRAETRPGMPQPDRSLVVFFFDLENNRVPSRYDAYLPMPSDDIVARLERGEGLIAAKKRPGTKPTIVLAAPRGGQLALVEEAFAKMDHVPFEAVTVPLPEGPTRDEIQATIRGRFKEIRLCYQDLLARDPIAQGKLDLHFAITPAGTVQNAVMAETTTLTDARLHRCVLDSVAKLSFPETGKKTTVKYPLEMTP